MTSHPQFHYTSCPQGKRVDGQSDFGIRAVTRGQERACVAFACYAAYRFKPLVPGKPSGCPPIRLAWLKEEDGKRLLVHSVHLPVDPSRRIGGNYFSHAIFGLAPDEASLSEAVAAWGSTEWVCADNGEGTELESFPGLPCGTVLGPEPLVKDFSNGDRAGLLEFVLSAWLTRGKRGSVYLVAPPETVAWCVYGLALVLPRSLTRDFTFSTYEGSPLQADTWLVGTWGDGGPPADGLPQACGTLPNLCWLPGGSAQPEPYAHYVAKALTSGDLSPVLEFVRKCEACAVKGGLDTELFRKIWRFVSDEWNNATLVAELLDHAGAASEFVGDAEPLREVIALIVSDRDFANTVSPKLMAAAKKGLVAESLVNESFNDAAVDAALGKNLERLQNARSAITKATFPATLAKVNPAEINEPVWSYLLPLVLAVQGLAEEHRKAWLNIGANRLGELFALPETDRFLGLSLHLSNGNPLPSSVVPDVANSPRLVADLIRRLEVGTTPAVETVLADVLNKTDLRKVCERFAKGELPECLVSRIVNDKTLFRQWFTFYEVQKYLGKNELVRRGALRRAMDEKWAKEFLNLRDLTLLPAQTLDTDLQHRFDELLRKPLREAAKGALELAGQLGPGYGDWEQHYPITELNVLDDEIAAIVVAHFPNLAPSWVAHSETAKPWERFKRLIREKMKGTNLQSLLLTETTRWAELPDAVVEWLKPRPTELAAAFLALYRANPEKAKQRLQLPFPVSILIPALAEQIGVEKPQAWELLDELLSLELKTERSESTLATLIRDAGLPLVQNHGVTRSVIELARQILPKRVARKPPSQNSEDETKFLLQVATMREPPSHHYSFLMLVSFAIGAEQRGDDLLNKAICGLAHYDKNSNERNLLANRVFGGAATSADTSRSANEAYTLLLDLGKALHPKQASDFSSWAHTQFDEFLANPPKELPPGAIRRRLAALIRLTLESSTPAWDRKTTACILADKLRRFKKHEVIFRGIWRCTDDWSEELARLWESVILPEESTRPTPSPQQLRNVRLDPENNLPVTTAEDPPPRRPGEQFQCSGEQSPIRDSRPRPTRTSWFRSLGLRLLDLIGWPRSQSSPVRKKKASDAKKLSDDIRDKKRRETW